MILSQTLLVESRILSCLIFPKFRKKKKPTLCPGAPLCIWALLHKALRKHVLTQSLTMSAHTIFYNSICLCPPGAGVGDCC